MNMQLAAFEGRSDVLADACSVLRMQVLQIPLQAAAEVARCHAVDMLELDRPRHAIGAQVPIPGAHVGGGQGNLETLTTGPLGGECGRTGQRDGALPSHRDQQHASL